MRLRLLLGEDGVELAPADLQRLGFHVNRSARCRASARQRYSKNRLPQGDIIRLTVEAREAGSLDEAFWRAFLAAHFGRGSWGEVSARQPDSAARLLCGFGLSPRWTWKVVHGDREALCRWLNDHADQLRTLSYGNHRKYESKKPQGIWDVIYSFVRLAEENAGHPSAVFAAEAVPTTGESFDLLYRRLSSLHRFGRTGRFDLLTLLADLELIDAVPARCYLRGATGPLAGARRLWGNLPVGELDDLAAALARRLTVSPQVIEDALCNWQK